MKDQERAAVLKMIEDGKISPEEGLRLMQALEQNPVDEEPTFTEAGIGSEPAASTPEAADEKSRAETHRSIQEVAEKGRRLWFIPLAVGIVITLLGGLIIYWNIHPAGATAWAYCLGLPMLLLGVAITALGAASRTARWLFVHIQQKSGERPQRIMLGFPLPLGLAAWILRTFGHCIPNLQKTAADEMIVALEGTTSSDTPLVVNVDEGEDGEKVQVYIRPLA